MQDKGRRQNSLLPFSFFLSSFILLSFFISPSFFLHSFFLLLSFSTLSLSILFSPFLLLSSLPCSFFLLQPKSKRNKQQKKRITIVGPSWVLFVSSVVCFFCCLFLLLFVSFKPLSLSLLFLVLI